MSLPRSSIAVVTLLLSCTLPSVAPGYIDCTPGTLNVILSAPHGGYETPQEIPDRVAGCLVNGQCIYEHGCGRPNKEECSVSRIRDSYTKELTLLVADELERITGTRPHVVVNNLYRGKMDANRDMDEATFGDPTAEEAYLEYHRCIVNAKATIEGDDSVKNRGLFVDLHGQGHPNNWAELGYAIPKTQLNSGDFTAADSSIYSLASHSSVSFDTLLRGSESFGYLLQQEGYNAVPSPANRVPGSEKYYSGGYNTKTYGSKEGGKLDAIQIESSKGQRAEEGRADYAAALARVITAFMAAHY